MKIAGSLKTSEITGTDGSLNCQITAQHRCSCGGPGMRPGIRVSYGFGIRIRTWKFRVWGALVLLLLLPWGFFLVARRILLLSFSSSPPAARIVSALESQALSSSRWTSCRSEGTWRLGEWRWWTMGHSMESWWWSWTWLTRTGRWSILPTWWGPPSTSSVCRWPTSLFPSPGIPRRRILPRRWRRGKFTASGRAVPGVAS